MPSPRRAADQRAPRRDVAGIIREIGDTGQGSIDIVLDFPACCNRIAGLQGTNDIRPRLRSETVPKKMLNELILEVNPTITAVATLLIAVTVLALAAVTLVLGRAGTLKQTIV